MRGKADETEQLPWGFRAWCHRRRR